MNHLDFCRERHRTRDRLLGEGYILLPPALKTVINNFITLINSQDSNDNSSVEDDNENN